MSDPTAEDIERQAHAEVSRIIDSPECHALAAECGPEFIAMVRALMVLAWRRGWTVGMETDRRIREGMRELERRGELP
jgi:hypothetical protein